MAAVGDAAKLKENTFKWSECEAVCNLWASHLEAIIYPMNNVSNNPKGVDGRTGSGTNIDAGLAFVKNIRPSSR